MGFDITYVKQKGKFIMNRITKVLSSLVAAVTLAVSVGVIYPSASISASAYLQGDVNGDGIISTVDSITLNNYLTGKISLDRDAVTRADATGDKMIDYSDYNRIMKFNIHTDTPKYVGNASYSTINDEMRAYYKYTYTNGTAVGNPQPYTLTVPSSPAKSSGSLKASAKSSSYNLINDTGNDNTVYIAQKSKTPSDYIFVGSGCIMKNGVIAVAASDICQKVSSSLRIKDDLIVRVYNSGESSYEEYEIDAVHIPQLFKTKFLSNNKQMYNYDYALLRISNNDIDRFTQKNYQRWKVGFMTDEFISTQSPVVTSGFTIDHYGLGAFSLSRIHRYLSNGTLINYTQSSYPNYLKKYMLSSTATMDYGDGGGSVYYLSDYNNNIIKSLAGICVYSRELGNKTWGCRMTPTISRFYLNNSKINN